MWLHPLANHILLYTLTNSHFFLPHTRTHTIFLSTDGQTIHVTVPSQPTSSYTEALLKLGAPMAVKVVSPSLGQTSMEIPFQQIRRFGCQVYLDSDIVWFETCNCKGSQQQFYFFVVASGIEKALSIIHDLKKSVEYTTRSLLIQEEGDEVNYQYSYISRNHYGCAEYSAFARDRVLNASLMHLAASTSSSGAISIRELNKLKRQRVSVPTIHTSGAALTGIAPNERRSTLANLHGKTSPDPSLSPVPGARRSPSPCRYNNASPTHSPNNSGNRMTLADRFRGDSRGGIGLSHSAGQVEFDSGITLDAVDPSRFSAPVPGSPRQKMENTHKMKSFDEKLSGHSPQPGRREGPRKASLAQMHDTKDVVNFVNSRKFSRDRRNDSANGSAELIIDEQEPAHNSSSGRYPRLSPAPPTSYDHLPPAPGGSPRLPPRGNGGISLAAYDHLDSSFAGLSLKNALGKRKDAAYVES